MKFNKDKAKVVFEGSLVRMEYGENKYSEGKEKYNLTIRGTVDSAILEEIKAAYFGDVKEKFLPPFIKTIPEPDKAIYLNLKSSYAPRVFTPDGKAHTWEGFLDSVDNLAPVGSECEIVCNLKEGAIYPGAIRFTELKKVTADDYFDI